MCRTKSTWKIRGFLSTHDSAKNIGDRQKAKTPKIGGVAEIYDEGQERNVEFWRGRQNRDVFWLK